MKTISLVGLFLFVISLPVTALSIITVLMGCDDKLGFGLFASGLVVGAVGLFFIVFGILLKCASILFRK